MSDAAITAISALIKAWTVTVTALALLAVAVALFPVWDSTVYLQALQATLARDM
jgi:hypothetical protein